MLVNSNGLLNNLKNKMENNSTGKGEFYQSE